MARLRRKTSRRRCSPTTLTMQLHDCFHWRIPYLDEPPTAGRVVYDGRNPDTTAIAEVMSAPVRSCKPGDDIEKLFDTLREHSFRHLMVEDNGEPVGVISLRDVALMLRST